MTESHKRFRDAALSVGIRPNWRCDRGHVYADETNDLPTVDINCRAGNQQDAIHLARYYALANPSAILELLAALERAEVDAARLNALEQNMWFVECHYPTTTWRVGKANDLGVPHHHGKTLRAAIDAAMRKD